MVFSSLTFLYFFLPLVCLTYFLFKNRVCRNVVLLVFSLFFYAWGEPKNILLMLAASLIAYIGGFLLVRTKGAWKKAVLWITAGLLTGNLFVFKYLNFVTENLHSFLSQVTVTDIALPIGISFYTFQILSYVIDLYRGEIALQKNYFYLTLYVSFFPQLIAGPIVRYQTIEEEINNRQETWDGFFCGLKRFLTGLAKKVLLANNVALIANIIYAGDPKVYGSLLYWTAAAAYALQIYFDFSGYSDMAIGLGRMFGFHFLENFDYPYLSLSVTEFWRRWHISLSTWFRDYIYIPLGGNRVKRSRWIFNILVVWGLTGFWHGAQWNFILWGLYYAALLLAEKLFLRRYVEKLPKFFQWLYAAVLILVGWVIFNGTDLNQMTTALQTMFSFRPTDWIGAIAADSDLLYGLVYLPLGVLCMFPWAKKIKAPEGALATGLSCLWYLGLFGLSILFIISSSFNPFIYFRF